jgi:hypothetical protein
VSICNPHVDHGRSAHDIRHLCKCWVVIQMCRKWAHTRGSVDPGCANSNCWMHLFLKKDVKRKAKEFFGRWQCLQPRTSIWAFSSYDWVHYRNVYDHLDVFHLSSPQADAALPPRGVQIPRKAHIMFCRQDLHKPAVKLWCRCT